MGKGTTPQNLVISWATMPQIDHNGPRFMYRVYYKRDIPGEDWIVQDINDWRKDSLLVDNQPTYQRYKIKVSAINEKGESQVPAKEVIGYSGEDGKLLFKLPSASLLINIGVYACAKVSALYITKTKRKLTRENSNFCTYLNVINIINTLAAASAIGV